MYTRERDLKTFTNDVKSFYENVLK
jgi:hypothetical protein